MQSTSPDLYMNMQQFSDLKLQARKHDANANKTVAQQFEGLFVQMMLKNMRAAATLDESQHSSTMDFYHDMYDKQLSQVLARQGGIGIADLLQQHLSGYGEKRQAAATPASLNLPQYRIAEKLPAALPMAVMDYQAENPAVKAHPLNEVVAEIQTKPPLGPASGLQSQAIQPFTGWQNADSFVSDLWPHAEKAAQKLGISAQVLVAQSALETGWGQHAMKKSDGSIAFNLFGIKAGTDWAGQSVVHNTLEFRQGAMQQESARFRAYDSVAEALDDYVDFVQNRPRYQSALQHGGSDRHYIESLHRAGYATDPAYADKILSIMNGQTFDQALAARSSNQPAFS